MADMDERILRAITGSSGCESLLELGDRRMPDDANNTNDSHALSSGWIARQVAADAAAAADDEGDGNAIKDEDDDDDENSACLAAYLAKRLAQLEHAGHAPRFGSIISLETSDASL
ncbi:hypothetical protein HDU88_005429 [Geranomyces variabilis]|nr:hypothetical protein HDU88_005429 [Geranomyces variabilis]